MRGAGKNIVSRFKGQRVLEDIRYVRQETTGAVTIVPGDGPAGGNSDLVAAGLRDAAGYPGNGDGRTRLRSGASGRLGYLSGRPTSAARPAMPVNSHAM